ncbi:MAG: T9SS type A sorting domain-containing protein [Bacteroidales bacterium]|nr:T9SS type A sorting domain-containing protein [Bacteroidales bacterium]
MKSTIIFSFFMILACLIAKTQNNQNIYLYPADDVLLKLKVIEDPHLIVDYMIYEDNFKALFNKDFSFEKTDTLIDGKRIIPVVFHIIHTYGSENINKAQILDGLEKINIDFNKQNADTVNTYDLFKSRAANCNIEFRLAQKDPNGNCTDGIVRHYTPETNYAYFNTMKKYVWDPTKYMNIFVVNFIYPEGLALPEGALIGGMSPFPPDNPLSQALTGGDTDIDGVLIRHDCIGGIGTAENFAGMPLNMVNRYFTHESGHYFNLYHTFQNLILGLIPTSSGCPSMLATTGDEVDDTPPVDQATQNTSISCFTPGSRNTCTEDPDEPDMIENYMDYQWGYCNNIFTLGQYQRIDATLNGYRRNLWSVENLQATGVLEEDSHECAPIADFFSNTQYVCAGSEISFFNASFNGTATTFNWTFQGGNPDNSTLENPTIIYNSPGVYSVTFQVNNAQGTNTLTKANYIHVYSSTTDNTAPISESFEYTPINDFIVINDTGSVWQIKTGTSYSGNKCIYLANFVDNVAGSKDEFITPAYNLTSLPSGHAKVSFKVAYSGKIIPSTILTPADTIYDKLTVYISNDCGKTWQSRLVKSGQNLITTAPIESEFTPSSTTQWAEFSFIIQSSYVQNYDNLRLKFSFYSNGGNNIYIDDINILSMSDINTQVLAGNQIQLYPNPLNENTQIYLELNNSYKVSLQIIDINGNLVHNILNDYMNNGNYSIPLNNLNNLSNGIYYIRVRLDNNETFLPLLKL